MRIRPAEPDDWPGILAINAEAAPGVSRLDAAELARLAGEAAFFRVCVEQGAALAYILAFAPQAEYAGEEFLWFRRHVPGSLYIDQVAIAGGARRRGIASALYQDAARFAAEHGLRRLSCEVNLHPPNPGSLGFHERLGFRQVGTMETEDGRVVSLQVLELAGPAPD